MHSSSRAGGAYRQGRTVSRDSGTSQDSYKDHHGDQRTREHHHGGDNHHHGGDNHHHGGDNHHHGGDNHHHGGDNHHPRHSSESKQHSSHRGGHPRNTTNGRGSETIGFIPGSADTAAGGRHACGSCASMGWSGCKTLICCVLTCGFYGSREPCLPVNESSTDHPSKAGGGGGEAHPVNGMALSNPTCGVPLDSGKPAKTTKLPASDSFRYPDVRIAGQTVVYPRHFPPDSAAKRSREKGKGESQQRPVSNTSLYSREDLDLDDLSDTGTDIDSLITKKLLELYALHQIDQLAKCTSDSSFSRKTNEISELIYSIAQDYNLEEQEAECKLVHGVIRISTRKGKRYRSPLTAAERHNNNGRSDGTLPDSGNETMTMTFSSDMPEVKVSEETSSDELARKMRHYSERTYSSSTATAYSPYHHETETDSSGAPLLYVL